MTAIQRHFIDLNGRHVHYRIAGNGPALLLIHQSPQNSRMWLEMMARFADRYTVIAPDTPGFGYSDALPGNPMTIAEFGQATLEFVEAIGLQRFAVFGMHTGGLIATWLAWANPQRVVGLIVDGYAAFTPEESSLYGETYLPPFIPQWDGSHLRWLWSRMREQKYFFPWYDGRADAAMCIAPQTTESTRDAVMDVLDVGDTYRAGYAAAFRHNDHHWVNELQMPSWMVFRHGDPLLAHMPRLQHLPEHVQIIEEPDGIPAMHHKMDRWLEQVLAQAPAFNVSPTTHSPSSPWQRRIMATPAGDMAVWQKAGEGCLRLYLHAPGTAPPRPTQFSATSDAWLVPDLPGHGASSESAVELTMDNTIAALLHAIQQCDMRLPLVIEADAAAAGFVPALVQALAAHQLVVQEVLLHSPWLLNAEEQQVLLDNLPRTHADRAGGYLCDVWQWERERHLLWPWLAPSAAARRRVDAPSPDTVHANVVEVLRLGQRLRRLLHDTTSAHLAEHLRALPVPVRIDTTPESDYQGRATALSA